MGDDASSVSMSPDSSGTTAPDTTPLNGSACNGQVNPGYEDTESTTPPVSPPNVPPPTTPIQNGGGGDYKSPTGVGDPVAEAVNLELVNMSPYSNSIPVKKESTELDMNDPYDEYFVPVNQHKKYIRGEKLYVTQDKRENLAGSKKKCCCGVVTVLVLGAIIAILVGVILTQDAMPESEARNYNKAGFGANLIPTPTPRPTQPPSVPTTEMPQVYLKNVLEGELTIDNMEFTPGLSDKNSSEFQMLATSLEEEIKTALFDHQTLRYGAADISLKVVEFKPGSVVVIYRVGWEFKEGIRGAADPINMETIKVKLQQHIRENDGFLYNYRVPSHSIKANRIKDMCKISNGGCSNECIYDPTLLESTCACPSGYILDVDDKNCIIEPMHVHHGTESLPPVHHHEEPFEVSFEKPDIHLGNESHFPTHHNEEPFELSTEKPEKNVNLQNTSTITSIIPTEFSSINSSESVHDPEVNTEIIHGEHIITSPPSSSVDGGFIEQEHSTERELETSFEVDRGMGIHDNETSSSKSVDENVGLSTATEASIVKETENVPVTETHEGKVDQSMSPPMEFLPEYSTYSENMNEDSEFTTIPSIIQNYSKEPEILEKKIMTTIAPTLIESSIDKMGDIDIETSNKTLISESRDETKTMEAHFENSTTAKTELDHMNSSLISNETETLNEWPQLSELGSEEINTNYSEVMNHLLSGETHMSQEVTPVQDKSNDTMNSPSLEIITSTTERPLEFNALETFREAKAANLTNSTSNLNVDSENSTIVITAPQNEATEENNGTEEMVPNSTLAEGLEVKPTTVYEVEKSQEVSIAHAGTTDNSDDIGVVTIPTIKESESMAVEKDNLKNEETPVMSGESTSVANATDEEITLFVTPPNLKSLYEEDNLNKNITDDFMPTSTPNINENEGNEMNKKIEESLNVENQNEEIVTEGYMLKNIEDNPVTETTDISGPNVEETATQLYFNSTTINSEIKTETGGTQDNETLSKHTPMMPEISETKLEANETMAINTEMKVEDTEEKFKDDEKKLENENISEMHDIMFEGNETKSKESEEKLLIKKNNLHTVNIDELLKESSNSLNSLDDDYDSTAIQEKYKPNKNKLIKNFDVKEIFEQHQNKSEKITDIDHLEETVHFNTSENEGPQNHDTTPHTLLSNDGYITEIPLFTTKKEILISTTEKTETPSANQDPEKNPLLISEEAYTTESPLFASKSPELNNMTTATPLIIDLLEDNKQNESMNTTVVPLNLPILTNSSETITLPEMPSSKTEEEQVADVKEVVPSTKDEELVQVEKNESEMNVSSEESTNTLNISKDEIAQIKEVTSFENETMVIENGNDKNQNETTTEMVDSVVKFVLNNMTTPYSKCASGQVPCKDGSGCIAPNQLCDSTGDCSDGSDEENCQEKKCLHNFQCTDGTCLKRHLVCDALKHCSDGSDEMKCEKWKCNFDEVSCYPSSKQCIPALWKCDGVSHCPKNEDEIGCKDSCENHEFLCPEGFCIPMSNRCDGIAHCAKGEDEVNCSS